MISVTQVARLPVSEDKVPWSAEWTDYAPQDFTAPFVQGVGYNIQCLAHSKKCDTGPKFRKNGLIQSWGKVSLRSGTHWTTPSTGPAMRFVRLDLCSHTSSFVHQGPYKVEEGRPLNIRGRTGLAGRGVLGKYVMCVIICCS